MTDGPGMDETAARPDALEPVGPPRRAIVEHMEKFVASGIVGHGPAHRPVFDKFESEHVTSFLNHGNENNKRGQISVFMYYIVGISLVSSCFLFLTWLIIPDYSDYYFEILEFLGVFAAGVGAGYGFKAYRDRDPA